MRRLIILFVFCSCTFSAHGVNADEFTNQYFLGTLDGKSPFRMILRDVKLDPNKESECFGTYYYLKYKKPIDLYGSCNNGKFKLYETSNGTLLENRRKYNQSINMMEGSYDGKEMLGIWLSADGKKSYHFQATQFSPSRKEILSSGIGTYKLTQMGAGVGLNGMEGYYLEDGHWTANGSAISDARREPYDINLSSSDIKQLSTFIIKITKQLDIEIYSENKIIAKIPFSDTPEFSITHTNEKRDKEENSGNIFKYASVGNFIGNTLHIITTDKFNIIEHIPIGVSLPQNSPSSESYAISMDYNPYGMSFSIEIIGNSFTYDRGSLSLVKVP